MTLADVNTSIADAFKCLF